MEDLKRLKHEHSNEYTMYHVVTLFNDFVNLNNTAEEKEAMLYARWDMILLKDASSTQYTIGVFALLYLISYELSEFVYIKIDNGIVSIMRIKPWNEVYLKSKSIL